MSNEILDIVPVRSTELTKQPVAEDFFPLLTVDQAVQKKGMVNEFISRVLVEETTPGAGGDYGKLPGMPKKILLKPGAEKLCSIFGLSPRYVPVQIIEDWTGKDHNGEALFYYEYKCELYRGDRFMGEAIGSSNTWESKYRYRWVKKADLPVQSLALGIENLPQRAGTVSEPCFAVDKGETSGKYGKPAEYWQRWRDAIKNGDAKKIKRETKGGKEMDAWEMGDTLYRIPNPDAADVVNTVQKMAQKRALVAAVLVVTNCSDAFTQDIEDDPERETTRNIDTGGHPVGTQAAQDHVRDQKLADIGRKNRLIPDELKLICQRIREKGGAEEAFKFMRDYLISDCGERGGKAYDAATAKLRAKYPSGKGASFLEIEECVLDLWDERIKLMASTTDPFVPVEAT